MKNIVNKFKSPISVFMLHSKSKNSRKQGFSLIELLVVVAIIGVVAAVAIPAFQTYQNNAKYQTIRASLSNINKGYKSCLVSNDGDKADCDTLAEINVEADANTTVVAKQATTLQCFDIKINAGLVADKKHQGCIQFSTTDGSTTKTSYDDGTNTGVCATAGSCG